MGPNRSVPTDTVLPHVPYRNVEDAIAWLTRAFGFTEHYRYGEPGAASGAQVGLCKAVLMLHRARPGSSTPAQLGASTQSLTVFLDDVENHFQRAKSNGAKILEEPHETEYGEFQYAAEDCDGHHWLFSRHATDRDPAEWGASVAHPLRLGAKGRPSFCYIEMPAVDAEQSATFYEKVFSWNIRHRDTSRPSFDDASGNISGAWVTGRTAFSSPGLLPYIWVNDINATLNEAEAHGATAVDRPHPDHPGGNCFIATFRDPGGNVIGLYEEPET
jgi:predicted enzyme related to lactoylglutathione lyase